MRWQAKYVDPEKALEAKERGNEQFRAGQWALAISEYEEVSANMGLALIAQKASWWYFGRARCQIAHDRNFELLYCKRERPGKYGRFRLIRIPTCLDFEM